MGYEVKPTGDEGKRAYQARREERTGELHAGIKKVVDQTQVAPNYSEKIHDPNFYDPARASEIHDYSVTKEIPSMLLLLLSAIQDFFISLFPQTQKKKTDLDRLKEQMQPISDFDRQEPVVLASLDTMRGLIDEANEKTLQTKNRVDKEWYNYTHGPLKESMETLETAASECGIDIESAITPHDKIAKFDSDAEILKKELKKRDDALINSLVGKAKTLQAREAILSKKGEKNPAETKELNQINKTLPPLMQWISELESGHPNPQVPKALVGDRQFTKDISDYEDNLDNWKGLGKWAPRVNEEVKKPMQEKARELFETYFNVRIVPDAIYSFLESKQTSEWSTFEKQFIEQQRANPDVIQQIKSELPEISPFVPSPQ